MGLAILSDDLLSKLVSKKVQSPTILSNKVKNKLPLFEHMFYNKVNLFTKDVICTMQRANQQVTALLQAAYQNNQVTSLMFNGLTYTGTVNLISATTVYLGMAAGRTCQIPLGQISQVKRHQFRSWWHLNDC